jgi:hypothetical protein
LIQNLTWHHLFNIWWITFALGFGWNMGRGLATPLIRTLRRKISASIFERRGR